MLIGLGACAPTQAATTAQPSAPDTSGPRGEEGASTSPDDRAATEPRRAAGEGRADALECSPERNAGSAHDCMGLNECKGKGGCKGASNECKGQNECKAKGNCKVVPPDCK